MDFHSQRPDHPLGEDRKQTVSFSGLTPFKYVTVIPSQSTKLEAKILELAEEFGLSPAHLNIDLGSLGRPR